MKQHRFQFSPQADGGLGQIPGDEVKDSAATSAETSDAEEQDGEVSSEEDDAETGSDGE